MKQIIIDRATRREVREKFKLLPVQMTHLLRFELTHLLRFELNSIRARKVRSYIMNYKEFHIVEN